MESFRILVIDDDKNHLEGMVLLLEQEGFEVRGVTSGRDALAILEQEAFDLVITDYKMAEMDGMRILKHLQKNFPALKVIMVTGFGSIEHAVEAMRQGAIHYITKPVNPQKLREVIRKVLQVEPAETETDIRRKLERYQHFQGLVGQSKVMQQVYRKIQDIAPTDVPVLILGESGTGKELVARAIHELSGRKNGPFVAVNTGAIPRELIASELFGHIKGSFTGAVSDRKGKFEEANHGTLFLDEISTMSLPVQISLLRVLESQVIERVGSSKPISVDVRIIAASNEDLNGLIQKQQFREDLFYRLNVFTIELPPLRNRVTDIPHLANYYREMFNLELGRQVKKIHPEAIAVLKKYPWPGNVRELRNVILRAMLNAGDREVIEVDDLPEMVLKPDMKSVSISFKPGTPLSEVEKTMIIQTLKAVNGNKLKAAQILGISRRSLYNKLEEYNLDDV